MEHNSHRPTGEYAAVTVTSRGEDGLGDSAAGLVISLSPLAVTLLPLLTSSTLLSVVEVVSALTEKVV